MKKIVQIIVFLVGIVATYFSSKKRDKVYFLPVINEKNFIELSKKVISIINSIISIWFFWTVLMLIETFENNKWTWLDVANLSIPMIIEILISVGLGLAFVRLGTYKKYDKRLWNFKKQIAKKPKRIHIKHKNEQLS